jgi:hypothetical protein
MVKIKKRKTVVKAKLQLKVEQKKPEQAKRTKKRLQQLSLMMEIS